MGQKIHKKKQNWHLANPSNSVDAYFSLFIWELAFVGCIEPFVNASLDKLRNKQKYGAIAIPNLLAWKLVRKSWIWNKRFYALAICFVDEKIMSLWAVAIEKHEMDHESPKKFCSWYLFLRQFYVSFSNLAESPKLPTWNECWWMNVIQ